MNGSLDDWLMASLKQNRKNAEMDERWRDLPADNSAQGRPDQRQTDSQAEMETPRDGGDE
jgi:hypothetical protein